MPPKCSWCRLDEVASGPYCRKCFNAYQRARMHFLRGTWNYKFPPCECCGHPVKKPPTFKLDSEAQAFFNKLYSPKIQRRNETLTGILAALAARK